MGMSQEEIEALMNETASSVPQIDETPESEPSEELSQDELAALVEEAQAQTPVEEPEVVEDEPEVEEEAETIQEDFTVDANEQDELAALIESSESTETSSSTEESTSEESIDDILAGIDGIVDNEPVADTTNSSSDESMEDILAGIDGIVDDEPAQEAKPEPSQDLSQVLNNQIDQGVYPLPVEKEHKVVNQLNEVAEDSEEKASQIFDVLSFILDENNEIQNSVNQMNDFVAEQTKLLEALAQKFPNIDVINQNLAQARELSDIKNTIDEKLNEENNQIFQAMDLMQFHDINRQKIERVMSVIKKLSTYLNGLFEDSSEKPEVQIARHISGDANETVEADDIDALIAEYSN